MSATVEFNYHGNNMKRELIGLARATRTNEDTTTHSMNILVIVPDESVISPFDENTNDAEEFADFSFLEYHYYNYDTNNALCF